MIDFLVRTQAGYLFKEHSRIYELTQYTNIRILFRIRIFKPAVKLPVIIKNN